MTQPIAGIKRRLLALIIDIMLLGALGGAVTFPLENYLGLDLNETIESVQLQKDSSQKPDPSTLVLIIIHSGLQTTLWALYFTIFIGACGQTPGKKLLGLRVIRADSKPMNFKTGAIRCIIGYSLSTLTFGLGFIWALFDNQKQALHDKIANTLVIQPH